MMAKENYLLVRNDLRSMVQIYQGFGRISHCCGNTFRANVFISRPIKSQKCEHIKNI